MVKWIMMMMMIMLPRIIPAMVINVCILIKWLISTGANIEDRLMA